MSTRSFTRRTMAATLTALVVVSGVGVTTAASAQTGSAGQHRADRGEHVGPHARSDHRSSSTASSRSSVDVKLTEGSGIELRSGRLVDADGRSIAAIDQALAPFPGVRIERQFQAPEAQVDATVDQAEAVSGQPQADLNLFFRLHVRSGQDTDALMASLDALDVVESVIPTAVAVPLPTANYQGYQGYRTAAGTGGIDADFAQAIAGGKGENVTITDVEYSWNRNHEDLSKARLAGSQLNNGTPCDPFATKLGVHSTDHGTAVLGELAGDANGYGVTGLVPAARIRTVNASAIDANGNCGYFLASAINVAANNSVAGDVILLEQQMGGPRYAGADNGYGYVPVEWDLATWNAIKSATSKGIVVVEAAGNGYQNLDDPIYNDANGKNWFSYDSGAILVGAGNAPGCISTSNARSRLDFSNYGTGLDLQGWGNCVVTAGYGDLQGGTNANLWYTPTFGGTSGASPIVTASAAILSSIAKGRGTTLTPAQIRYLLAVTGQPQTAGLAGLIGPMPNLRTAIAGLGPKVLDAGRTIGAGTLSGTKVPVQQTWSSVAGATYEVWLATDGGTFARQTLSSPTVASAVFQLERNHKYQFAARARDTAGVWGDWTYGPAFNLGAYQENYSATNPAYTGVWTRSAWASASDGYVTVSSTAGNKARFTFTGSSIGWVSSLSTNRGKADVYVDGVFAQTVDLYSATTTAQAIVFRRTWATSGTHSIEIRVQGTAGRPKVDVDAFVRIQ